jgi:dTDP-4-amino-4,6-dideoxygalactose transaminase
VTVRIPFNRTSFLGNERLYMEQALAQLHIASDGPFSKRAAETLRQALGVSEVLLTTSCTDALEIASLLLELGPGDEVIMPSFTFVSTANAFVLRGATPVFVDIRPDTYNLDERLLEAAITPRTKAIVVVHYAGVACEMDAILELARARSIPVIEDNAHGLFGRYRGRPLGGLGELATLSFHETKNLSCGEGGAIALREPTWAERCEIVHAKGTNRALHRRGVVDKYTWVDIGSSFAPSDLVAAVLVAQLEQREAIQSTRRTIHERYRTHLAPLAERFGLHLQAVPAHCEPSYHLFSLLLRDRDERDALIAELRDRGILAVFHYVPLHSSPMGSRVGRAAGPLPVTDSVAARLVRLPFYGALVERDQLEVIDRVTAFVERRRGGALGA